MQVLFPTNLNQSWQERLGELKRHAPLRTFEPLAVEFIHRLSKRILLDRRFRAYAEIMAMAHWMRKANIEQLERNYHARRKERIWQPRGIILHFAPSNVDTIFIYSWFLSLLVGNKNVIRMSQRRDEQIGMLVDLITELTAEPEFTSIAERTLIVSYEHDAALTSELSGYCDVRVIWGGDDTVRRIRQSALPPRATELVFADRFSFSAIRLSGLAQLEEAEWDKLALNFYNDAYWFNQMACSSPRLLVWVGESEEAKKLKQKFWLKLDEVVRYKGIHWESAVGINRLVEGYAYAAKGIVDQLSTRYTQQPYRANVSRYDDEIRSVNCGGGFFFELSIDESERIVELASNRDQTLTVFGFEREELQELAWKLTDKGIDRIVPIGEALNFSEVWDGYDFFVYFTREISVRF